MIRYSIIHEKNPREIILLRGRGCRWRKCTFCDYHFDCSSNEEENLTINRQELAKVTGLYHRLEVINSGSFLELGEQTLQELIILCKEKEIHTLHFECHWLYRNAISFWRQQFAQVGTTLKIKIGIETFDYAFREQVLVKGIKEQDPQQIASVFDECCLLFGLTGQTTERMKRDIEIGLTYFQRVCVNVFVENTTGIKPDPIVISEFITKVMPQYIENDRVDILLENTDFGVGGEV